MEYYKEDLTWDYEARKYLCGIVFGAGTAGSTAGSRKTPLYKPH